ncbi:MAG: inorganic phosphate transporter, partial [Smithellaceae bacterium]|nr:inorganic phosphate transporter [Smithellaceae bacterium]
TGTQKLFFLGALSIEAGVFTYAKRVINTVGNDIYKLTPVTALIVVLAQALVLFLFSSQEIERWLIVQGLPSFPLVPVSSSQAVVGAIIGVGIAKAGGRGINFRILGKIALGWVVTPLISILLCLLSLFFVQNVFQQPVVQAERYELDRAVIAALEKENIPTAPLKGIEGARYTGSETFRDKLESVHNWKEGELFQIFHYAHVEGIRIDAEILHSRFNIKYFTPEEISAVLKLDGRTFPHRWQLYDALAALSPAWKKREAIKQNKPFNDQLKKKQEMLGSIFHKKIQKKVP